MKTTANPERCSVASGSPLWWGGNITPSRKGWYITRTEDGFVSWRAWGNGAWWKQIKGGWIESYTGDGCALRYDWQPQSRQSIDLDHDKLPDLANACDDARPLGAVASGALFEETAGKTSVNSKLQ